MWEHYETMERIVCFACPCVADEPLRGGVCEPEPRVEGANRGVEGVQEEVAVVRSPHAMARMEDLQVGGSSAAHGAAGGDLFYDAVEAQFRW